MSGEWPTARTLGINLPRTDAGCAMAKPVGRTGCGDGMLEKGDERATSTRSAKPRRSAGLNAQGESPTRKRLRYSPMARQHGKEGSNGQKRRETGRVRCWRGGVSGWLDRMCWGPGFAERVDRHRRSSMIERGLTKWSSAASVASPLQRRVRPSPT